MRPPPAIKSYVKNFAGGLVRDPRLQYVAISPSPGALPSECFPNVEAVIAEKGGRMQYGWALWEWPRVLMMAEFHAVWVAPDGVFHDPTPRLHRASRILFLSDPVTPYEGRQIPAVWKPLANNAQVYRHCEIEREIGLELNKGDLADFHGLLSKSPKHLDLEDELAESVWKISSRYGVWSPEA